VFLEPVYKRAKLRTPTAGVVFQAYEKVWNKMFQMDRVVKEPFHGNFSQGHVPQLQSGQTLMQKAQKR
jgi:hypothetical protein